MSVYDYDIAISYARENKKIADSVAKRLQNLGIRVFYDEFFPSKLWGKDLAIELEKIFTKKSKYCLMLISKDYIRKDWTRQETKYALSRQIKEHERYILPIHLDDMNVPGLSDLMVYRKTTSEEEIVNLVTSVIKEDKIEKSQNEIIDTLISVSCNRIEDLYDLWGLVIFQSGDTSEGFSVLHNALMFLYDINRVIDLENNPKLAKTLREAINKIGNAHNYIDNLDDGDDSEIVDKDIERKFLEEGNEAFDFLFNHVLPELREIKYRNYR